MTEAIAMTLESGEGWRRLGSAPEEKPIEVILRSFDRPVLFATGSRVDVPEGEPVLVAAGEGVRLEGRHFFARPAAGEGKARILVRGFE
jgi:hypothetical protein